MRDQMKNGQLAFFYHSNCKPPGIVGIVEVYLINAKYSLILVTKTTCQL